MEATTVVLVYCLCALEGQGNRKENEIGIRALSYRELGCIREEALTETGQNSVLVPKIALTVCTTRLRGQLHTILKDMDHYPNACSEELEAFMTLWDVKPRVKESLLEALSVEELITQVRQLCEDAEDHASNAQEEARQKRKDALEEVIQRIYRNNN
ncbi:hypothetical protein Tco_0708496 [Tanacetum coccineum]